MLALVVLWWLGKACLVNDPRLVGFQVVTINQAIEIGKEMIQRYRSQLVPNSPLLFDTALDDIGDLRWPKIDGYRTELARFSQENALTEWPKIKKELLALLDEAHE